MTSFVLLLCVVWIVVVATTLFQWLKHTYKLYKPNIFEDGYNYIIIDGTESTKYPERYSEGVFAWCEGGKLKTSEEYQIENGGDPIVLKKYLLKSNPIQSMSKDYA